jgi:hypothetical protein
MEVPLKQKLSMHSFVSLPRKEFLKAYDELIYPTIPVYSYPKHRIGLWVLDEPLTTIFLVISRW